MARALVEPLLQRGELDPGGLMAVVGRAASIEPLSRELPSGVRLFSADAATAREVWTAPLQLLAIKPQQLDAVAAEAPAVVGQPLLISVLAGVSLARLQRLFPGHRCIGSVAWGLWHGVCGMGSVAWGLWHGVCGMGSVAWGLWHGVCGMGSVAWGLWH